MIRAEQARDKSNSRDRASRSDGLARGLHWLAARRGRIMGGGQSPAPPLRGYPAMPTPRKKPREAPSVAQQRMEKGRLSRVTERAKGERGNAGWDCWVAAKRRGLRGAKHRCKAALPPERQVNLRMRGVQPRKQAVRPQAASAARGLWSADWRAGHRPKPPSRTRTNYAHPAGTRPCGTLCVFARRSEQP